MKNKIFFTAVFTALLILGCKNPIKNTEQVFSVEITQPENGTITVKKGSTELKDNALKSIAKDTELTFELSANDGYEVKSLTVDGKSCTTVADKKIRHALKITKDISVTGLTAKVQSPQPAVTHRVTVTQPANGKISVLSGTTELTGTALTAIADNTELTFELSANDGYEVKSLTVDGKNYTTVADKKIRHALKITKDISVTGLTAKVESPQPAVTHRVTVTQPANGKISVLSGTTELTGTALTAIADNTELTFELSANSGYEAKSLTVDGKNYTTVADKKIRHTARLTKDISVTGNVIEKIITVTVEAGSDKVTVNTPKSVKVKSGTKWQTVKPQISVVYTTGWEEDSWRLDKKDGGTLTDEYVFTEDKTVFALAKKSLAKFKVEVTQPEGGTITVFANTQELKGEALNSVIENTVLTITVTANTGYCVQSLTVNADVQNAPNGTPSSSLSKTITVARDLNISSELKKLFKITVTKPENGSITVTKDDVPFSDFTKVVEGTTLNFKLSANTDYKVKTLTVTPESGSPEIINSVLNGVISKDIKVTSNLTVTGEVEKDMTPPPGPQTEEIDIEGVKFTMVDIEAVTDKKIVGNNVVSLSAYQIAETETTQLLYEKITGSNPSTGTSGAATGETQNLRPVETVSWYEAVAFCNLLTEKVDGKKDNCVYYSDEELKTPYTVQDAKDAMASASGAAKKVYAAWSKTGFRLPTEAEWEWAAKGGAETKYAGSDDLDAVAWYDSIGLGFATHQVKKKVKNGYGLYDMSGNVSEWCWNYYDLTTAPGNNGQDPKGPNSGKPDAPRIAKGGSGFFVTYTIEEFKCTNHNETGVDPKSKNDFCGFRIVRKK